MKAPLCDECRLRPVQRRYRCPSMHLPKRGLRIIGGVSWNWFCSKTCSGAAAGRRNVTSGQFRLLLARAEAARRASMARKREARIGEDVKTLTALGVPRAVAEPLLLKLFERGRSFGYEQAYNQAIRQPRRAQAS